MNKSLPRLLALVSLLIIPSLVAACGERPAPPPTIATPAPTAVPPTVTVVPPTATKVPATATLVPASVLATELTNLVRPTLPTPPATPGAGNMDVSVLQLKTSLGNLWLAYSTGMRSFQPLINHFVAVYLRGAAGWQQVSKLDVPGPDYLSAQSVRQVQLDPERIWLQVDGGSGAHSGSFSLVSFDGKTLRLELENLASSPGSSRVGDLNGDKMQDVILDHTDYYVFCYACGVRYFRYEVRSWDGAKLSEVKLAPLPDAAAADVRTPNNKAVTLAQAGLWKDAQATIAQVKPTDPLVAWNAALIKLHADLFAKQAVEGPYPLLDHLFYGDFAAALDVMRPIAPDQLFGSTSPLLTEQIAKGWEKSITQWITKTTTLAIGVQPDLAAAYFLRGWALNLAQSGSPAALVDVEKAAQLAPSDPLFMASLQYLRRR